MCGKVPQEESAEGTWLQNCFCAGLKSYHGRAKLAREAGMWDRGEGKKGWGQRVTHARRDLSSEEPSGLPPSLEQTKLKKKSWKEKLVYGNSVCQFPLLLLSLLPCTCLSLT